MYFFQFSSRWLHAGRCGWRLRPDLESRWILTNEKTLFSQLTNHRQRLEPGGQTEPSQLRVHSQLPPCDPQPGGDRGIWQGAQNLAERGRGVHHGPGAGLISYYHPPVNCIWHPRSWVATWATLTAPCLISRVTFSFPETTAAWSRSGSHQRGSLRCEKNNCLMF